MRLVTYKSGGPYRCGILRGGHVLDAVSVASAAGLPPSAVEACRSTRGVLTLTEIERRALVDTEVEPAGLSEQLHLGPPVTDPEKILCLGLNYKDHAQESDMALPKAP